MVSSTRVLVADPLRVDKCQDQGFYSRPLQCSKGTSVIHIQCGVIVMPDQCIFKASASLVK